MLLCFQDFIIDDNFYIGENVTDFDISLPSRKMTCWKPYFSGALLLHISQGLSQVRVNNPNTSLS